MSGQLEAWLQLNQQRGLSRETIETQRWVVEAFLHATGLLDPLDAKYRDLTTFAEHARKRGLLRRSKTGLPTLGRRLSEASLRQVTGVLSSFYHYLIESGSLSQHPFPRRRHLLRSIKATQTNRRSLTLDELQQLLAKTRDSLDFATVTILGKTALRVGEFCGIHDVDLNLTTGRLRLVRRDADGLRIGSGKYPKRTNDTIWLDSETIAAIRAYKQDRRGPPGPTFRTRDGRPLTKSYVNYQIIEPLALASGLVPDEERRDRRRNITPHVFRHTWTSLMKSRGMPDDYWLEYRGDLRRRHVADQYTSIPEQDLRRVYLQYVFPLNLKGAGRSSPTAGTT